MSLADGEDDVPPAREGDVAAPSAEVAASVPPTPAQRRRATIVNIIRWALIALVVAAAVFQLWINWEVVMRTVTAMQWPRVLLAFLAAIAGVGFATMSWSVLVDDLGKPIGVARSAQVFLVGQLGKYLPGSVWAYILQIELGHKAGLARARTFAATVFNLAVILVAALLAGALAVPELVSSNPELSWLPWLYLLLPVGLVMLHPKILTALASFGFRVLRRPRPDHPIRLRVVALSLGYALLTYLCYGTHLWLLADTWEGISITPLGLCIGTMAIAMVVGLVAFLLPSGFGAREFVIIAALAPLVGIGPATAYAAVSRLMFIIVDLLTAGSAAAIAVVARRRQGAYQGDPGVLT